MVISTVLRQTPDTRVSDNTSKAAMATRNVFEEYDSNEDIECYIDRLSQYLIAIDLPDTDNNKAKRKAILLASIGSETYKIMKDLAYPTKPTEKSFNQLCDILKQHYKPTRLIVTERFKFNSAKQQQDQSINEYVSHLKQLATHCEFTGDTLTDNLRDRFICGLRSEALQKKLLAKNNTFEEVVKLALAEEAAVKDMRDITGRVQDLSVNAVAQGGGRPRQYNHGNFPPRSNYKQKPKPGCERCGMNNHTSDICRYKNAQCYRCKSFGHLQSECRAKRVQYVDHNDNKFDVTDPDIDMNDHLNDAIFTAGDNSLDMGAIKVQVNIENKVWDMILDTGAAVSLINYADYLKQFKHIQIGPTEHKLHTYCGTPLTVLGEIPVKCVYGEQNMTLPLVIVKADVYAPPLFGRNWLRCIKLDWKGIFMAEESSHSTGTSIFELMKDKYPSVFQQGLGTVKNVTAKLHLKDDVKPVFLKPRSVPYALRPAVEKELQRMESEGIIQRVDFSDWGTPLVVVPKSDNSVRLCGDYKVTVNPHINTDKYPIPTFDEVLEKISEGQKYSKIDLKCAYQQLLLDEESQKLVTISTHKGLYRYTRLPYGISSSPAIWQRYIDQVLAGLDFTCAIIDDVIVTGPDDQSHIKNLHKLFQRLQNAGLRVKAEKCAFMQDSIEYMGKRISERGIQSSPVKVKAIKEAPAPQNVNQLRSWLGMVNFHAQQIQNLSTLAYPMNQLLGDKDWSWSSECQASFEAVKNALSSETYLAHYNPKHDIEISTDASPYGLGACINHVYPDGSRKPVAYASRTLSKHEKGYSQLDKEALGIMFGIRRFHMYIYGRSFTLVTDSKPVEHILGPKKAIPTMAAQRLQRWAVILSAFNYKIRYIPSKENVTADALSRLPIEIENDNEDAIYQIENLIVENLPITHKQISNATRRDPVLSKVLQFVSTGWPNYVNDEKLKPYFAKRYEISVEQDCLLWGLRVIIPERFTNAILRELHFAHPGIIRMKELARSHVWWPKIDNAIEQTVRDCGSCQQARSLPPPSPLMPWIWPGAPWHRVHIDFAEKDGQNFLIVVDAYAKWPEIILMNSTTSNATITVLRDLFSKYGIPNQIVSDNGPQFRSEEFKIFLKRNGVKQILVSAYHAASNGAAERMVQSFKRYLTASKRTRDTIQERIANFLLCYRSTKHSTTGCTPAKLFMGRELRTRLSLVHPDIQNNVENKQSAQIQAHDKKCPLREFVRGEGVWVKDPIKRDKWFPGLVENKIAPKTYIIKLDDGRVWKRHVDHMRKGQIDKSQNIENEQSYDNENVIQNDIVIGDMYDNVMNDLDMRDNNDNETRSVADENTEDEPLTVDEPRRSSRMRKAPDRLIESS